MATTRIGRGRSRARATREAKTSERGDDLIARWRTEVAAVGWKPERLAAAVDKKGLSYVAPGRLSKADLDGLIAETLDVDGGLARRKVFTRADVIVAVAPKLFGPDPAELGRVTDRLLAGQEILPLRRTSVRSERGYVLASTIATEHTIAEIAQRQMGRTDAAQVATKVARAAVAVTTSGRGMDGAEPRHGDPAVAVARYAEHDRITTAHIRDDAIDAVVDAWATDHLNGLDSDMYAWRRGNVAALNTRARQAMHATGKLRGPKLVTENGATYQAGDRVVTLS